MEIAVYDFEREPSRYSVEELVAAAPEVFELATRVPQAEGQAFDLKRWYTAWKNDAAAANSPTHLKVVAADEFQALIAWEQLDLAAILFSGGQRASGIGHSLRLYVPDGNNNCLNVKNVVQMHFIKDHQLAQKPVFGFRNELQLDQLKKGQVNPSHHAAKQ